MRHRLALLVVCATTAVGTTAPAAGLAPSPNAECLVPGVDDRCERWVRAIDHPSAGAYGQDRAVAAVVSPDGSRVFITGTTTGSDSGFPDHDIVTTAIDGNTGNVVWKQVFNGPEANDDYPAAVAISPDGSRLFVGASVNDTSNDGGIWNRDFGVIAYSASTGAQQWVRTYDGFELQGRDYGNNELRDLAVSPSGEVVYLTGPSLAGGSLYDHAVFAYDADTGAERWRARYDRGNGNDRSRFVVPGRDRVYVVGTSDLGTGNPGVTDGNSDIVIRAYGEGDAERRGRVEWTARRDTHGGDLPIDVTLTPDGSRLLVLERRPGSGGVPDGLNVVAFDTSTGQQAWVAQKLGTQPITGAALAVSPTGDRFFVTGRTVTPQQVVVPRNLDYSTSAFRLADGSEIWTKTYGLPASSEEEALAMAVNPTGTRVYVTGYSSEPYYTYVPPVVTLAYDAADGTQKWVARHRRTVATLDHDAPVAAAVSPNGQRLYIGATFTYRPDVRTTKIATSDIAVIAYDTCELGCGA